MSNEPWSDTEVKNQSQSPHTDAGIENVMKPTTKLEDSLLREYL